MHGVLMERAENRLLGLTYTESVMQGRKLVDVCSDELQLISSFAGGGGGAAVHVIGVSLFESGLNLHRP